MHDQEIIENTKRVFVEIFVKSFDFQGTQRLLIQMVNLSEKVLYDQALMENHLLALISATVSHEVRNPLNSIIHQNDFFKSILTSMKQ